MRKLPKHLVADRPQTTLLALYRGSEFVKVIKVPDERLGSVASFKRCGEGLTVRLVKRRK